MTREEAIDRLTYLMSDLNDFYNESKHMSDDDRKEMESLDMAIKALEKEPCEDAVSRAEVMDELNRLGRNAFKDDTDYDGFFAFLDNLLPVTPTRKKCRNINSDYAECDQFVCSNCGVELQNWHRVERDAEDGDITYREYEFNYCPNCGADMRESEGEDE